MGGIIGVTTAYRVAPARLAVTVCERRAGVAEEASAANAGVIAPGYPGPWPAPVPPAPP
jgi:D-amino-acid dehydrogenase